MYQLIKPILFLLDPENAHAITTRLFRTFLKLPFAIALVRSRYCIEDPSLERHVFGLKFKNPVGLAAGFDKNAELVDDFANLGFGFIEIGTLTPKAQSGNPKPRLFRLPKDRALINRMGFNNNGVEEAVMRLRKRNSNLIVGGNIGKNKLTPNAQATEDYLICLKTLFDYVDYFVVNVSSPNTPGLRELQEKEPLTHLLLSLQEENQRNKHPKPLLLKIAPDLTLQQLDDIVSIVKEVKLDGLIISNTTIERTNLNTSDNKISSIGAGGLSGAPVFSNSTEKLKYVKAQLPEIPIIAVGGIMSAQDALMKLQAGADLVQVYTGLIYQGPALIRSINKALLPLA